MKKLTIEQLKELLEFHYGYDDLVTVRNHIKCVIENIDNGRYDNISNWLKYEEDDEPKLYYIEGYNLWEIQSNTRLIITQVFKC